jgi:hypothetical protein
MNNRITYTTEKQLFTDAEEALKIARIQGDFAVTGLDAIKAVIRANFQRGYNQRIYGQKISRQLTEQRLTNLNVDNSEYFINLAVGVEMAREMSESVDQQG